MLTAQYTFSEQGCAEGGEGGEGGAGGAGGEGGEGGGDGFIRFGELKVFAVLTLTLTLFLNPALTLT